MSPKAAPDLDLRREQITQVASQVAESEGWTAVTMRRLATEIGVSQPVLYSAFSGRQALIDAVALTGFGALTVALEAVEVSPMARMRAYLDFAASHPNIYDAMFSMPSGLPFGAAAREPLSRAFSAIRDAFPGFDDTRAEVAWATLHGLATLQASGRLPKKRVQARFKDAHQMLTHPLERQR
jgi:AcrR family transcriptional regulator